MGGYDKSTAFTTGNIRTWILTDHSLQLAFCLLCASDSRTFKNYHSKQKYYLYGNLSSIDIQNIAYRSLPELKVPNNSSMLYQMDSSACLFSIKLISSSTLVASVSFKFPIISRRFINAYIDIVAAPNMTLFKKNDV